MSAAEEENDESFIEGSKNKIKPRLCLLRAWESWRLFFITRRPHDEEGAPPPPPAPLAETDVINAIVPQFSSFNTFDEKYNLYYPAQPPP